MLTSFGFNKAVELMAIGLGLSFLLTLILHGDIGKMKNKPIFKDFFSKSQGINVLSFARFFLFGARDVWFVVALPVFLETYLNWNFSEIGAFLGLWVIGYGLIQACVPSLRSLWTNKKSPGVSSVQFWIAVLTAIPGIIAIALWRQSNPEIAITVGLIVFGFIFAMKSSIHLNMFLAYTDKQNVSLNIGFYYMANATGRLLGTLLSGILFMLGANTSMGMQLCLWCSILFVFISLFTSLRLPPVSNTKAIK